jgi:sugar O-acyltransferase (sialic acid O-acetyltransferase NeuD family)
MRPTSRAYERFRHDVNAHPSRDAATPLLIFPCNGNGAEAIDCLPPRFRLLAFVDDTAEKRREPAFGHPVCSRDAFTAHDDAAVLAVPGSAESFRARREVIGGLDLAMHRFATVIHRSAVVSAHAMIGRNVLIMAGVVVTSNARIGDHVCILPNTVVHHDAVVGDFSIVGANVTIAGGTLIGDNCYIASGSSVMNGIRIGERALVGLGSTVLRDVAADAVVAGNPARVL